MANSPKGLRQLINLPTGSAEGELGTVLLLVQVYRYLEATSGWDALGGNVQKNSADLTRKIREGENRERLVSEPWSYFTWREPEATDANVRPSPSRGTEAPRPPYVGSLLSAGLVAISSFRQGSRYSMWSNREASTWSDSTQANLTASRTCSTL